MGLTLNGENGIVYNNLNADIKNLLMPKNWIINGMFDVWQRGTSFNSGAGANLYAADRFQVVNGITGSTATTTRQSFTPGQTEVPNNPKYFIRSVLGNYSSSNFDYYHKVEDITKLAGKQVTLSFWVKASTNINMDLYALSIYDGSTNDSTNLGAEAVTTSWKRVVRTFTVPSVFGKTIGAKSNLLLIQRVKQNCTFDIANISLVEGSVPVECQTQPYADVLRECQRYYQRFGGNSVYEYLAQGIVSHTTIGRFLIPLNGKMRAMPQLESAMLLIVQPASSNLAVLSVGIDMAGTDACSINATCAGGLTLSQPVYLTTNNNLSGYIAFNAEL